MRAILTLPIITFAALLVVPSAFASGSYGSGSGSGSYPSNPSSASTPSTPRDPAAEAYARGKSMVKKRIACKKCAYPAGVQDTPTARKVAAGVRAGQFTLKPGEREQVLYYLAERFGA